MFNGNIVVTYRGVRENSSAWSTMGGDSGSNLEMRCSADEAWYDGTLSFAADSKDMILVHFNDFDDEEDEKFPASFLLDPKKLKSRVRVRSLQLQDNQCSLVSDGHSICGSLDDGENLKYYDARVLSIVKKNHLVSDDGGECKCEFKLHWLDGPKKGEDTVVGCAEVCFLSHDAPEDDPMVKSLVKRLAGNGRKLAAPKAVPSPRPMTSLPSLELAPSRKLLASKDPSPFAPSWKLQASKDPSPVTPSKKLQASKDPSEPAPLKKQSSSKEQRTPSTYRVQVGQQHANSKSVRSKKKRIMQAEVVEQPDLASDNDTLEMHARPTSYPKAGSEDARGHGNESDNSERRGGGGESSKKGFVPVEKRRLGKGNTPKVVVPSPVVVVREEEAAVKPISFRERLKLNTKKMAPKKISVDVGASRDEAAVVTEGDALPLPVQERVKSNTKKTAAPDVAAREEAATAVRENDEVHRSTKLRVKFNTSAKTATPDIAAAHDEAAAIREDDIPRSSFKDREKLNTKQIATTTFHVAAEGRPISLTLGERVKLKSAEKSKSASQTETTPQKKKLEADSPQKKLEADSPQKKKLEVDSPQKKKKPEASTQKKPEVSPQKKKPTPHKGSLQEVGMQVVGKQIQKNRKQALLEDNIPSRLTSKPDEATSSRPSDVVVAEPNRRQKRRPGRPRKHPLPEPVKPVSESKKQPVVGLTRQNSQQEEIIDAINAASSDPAIKMTSAKKKRPREEEQTPLPDFDSEKSTQEDEETPHVKKTKTARPWRESPQNDDAGSNKSEDHTAIAKETEQLWRESPDDEDEDHTPIAKDITQPWRGSDEEHTPAATPVVKKSMAERFYDIQMKFGSYGREYSVEKTSEAAHEAITPGSSEELVGSPRGNQIQENGKRRRRMSQMVLSDDEPEEDVDAAAKKQPKTKDGRGTSVDSSANGHVDECINDPKTTSTSALDEDLGVVQQNKRKENSNKDKAGLDSRLLLISNMEKDVSAHDVMQLLQKYTDGVCAVHVLPVLEFQSFTSGYALYRDNASALKAFQHLANAESFVVSPKGRPWIVSQSTDVYGPHFCGFAAHAAFKSDDTGVCGIISDQPPVQELFVVTKQRDSKAYSLALQRSKMYEEHKKWRMELYDKIVQDEIKG